jgi:hypothetical protein
MAKAGGETTTTWIWLFDARALVVRAYGATQLAERLLVEWLGDGRVRFSCKLFEAARVSELAKLNTRESEFFFIEIPEVAYSDGDPAFWRIGLKINWEESWAHETHAIGGNKAWGDQGGARGCACFAARGAGRQRRGEQENRQGLAHGRG